MEKETVVMGAIERKSNNEVANPQNGNPAALDKDAASKRAKTIQKQFCIEVCNAEERLCSSLLDLLVEWFFGWVRSQYS